MLILLKVKIFKRILIKLTLGNLIVRRKDIIRIKFIINLLAIINNMLVLKIIN
jgi:hypothetical protein